MIRILVVDDEADIEALITQKFRRKVHSKEWEFTFGRNGEDALKILSSTSTIDIVLSDINMPKMDGLTLLQKINEKEMDLRTIVVSAYSDIENIRTAMNNGAFDFITKPINFQDMEITIQKSFHNLQEMRNALRSRNDLLILKKELNLAKKIQQSILPRDFNLSKNCELHAFMEPAKEVGGDFYDFFKLDSKHISFLVADVSGKGVPAALFAMVNQTLFRSLSSALSLSTAEIVTKINERCSKNNDNCMFITLFYGILNVKTGEFTFTNAGHNPPVLMRSDGKCEILPLTKGVPVGISEEEKYIEKKVTLKTQDTLFIYTDGVTEMMNRSREEYGINRLVEHLIMQSNEKLPSLCNYVHKKVFEFAEGTPQFDDFTYLSIRYLED